MTNHSLGVLFAVIIAIFWALLAIALKMAIVFIDSQTIIWFRFSFSFICLMIFYLIKRPKDLKILLRPPLLAIVSMLALAFNYFGYMKGIELTYASNAQVIIQGGPLILIILGIFILKERINKRQVFGFALVAGGFYLFYNDQLTHLLSDQKLYNIGNLWVFAAAITWAIYAFFQKKLVKEISPQKLNLLTYGYSALIFTPLSLPHKLLALSMPQWWLMIFLGANTLIAYGLLSEALKKIPANQVSIIITCNPVLTIVLMTLLNHWHVSWVPFERIGTSGFVGAFGVIVGAIIVIKYSRTIKRADHS